VKKTAFVLSLILIICSVTGVLLETAFRDDLRIQRLFARFFVLSDQRVLKRADALRKSADPESLKRAVELYREALSRDAANPYRWCDLGQALFESKKTEEARRCYERAIELGPNNVQTLSRVVDFYISVKQPREALRYASRILEKYPQASESVFWRYVESGFDFADTLSYGIPPDKAVAQDYMRYLIRYGDGSKAEQCWRWILEHSFAEATLAGDYSSFLIRRHEEGNAFESWAAWIGARSGTYLMSNFIYNAGFEDEPCRSPFDWNISGAPNAEASRDMTVRRSGNYSLRIEFDGKENLSYHGVSQITFLKPGSYRFRAYLKTEGITTDQGIELRISQATPSVHLDVRTEQVKGSTDWRALEKSFDLRQAGLIRIEVFREPSEKFDNKLAGTVWLDDLELSQLNH
jgi:tetratricopeptide (TPR) repeat protein